MGVMSLAGLRMQEAWPWEPRHSFVPAVPSLVCVCVPTG